MTDEGCTSFLDDFLGQSQHFSDKRIRCEVKREPCRQGKRTTRSLVVVRSEMPVTVRVMYCICSLVPRRLLTNPLVRGQPPAGPASAWVTEPINYFSTFAIPRI